MRPTARGVRVEGRTGAANRRLSEHRLLWLPLWLLLLTGCAHSAVPERIQQSGVAPSIDPTAAPTPPPTATVIVRPTSVPTAEPESGPLSHSGSGSERTQRFHLRSGDYAISWEAQPLLPSGIGCSLRGSLQAADGGTVFGQFEDQVVPGEDRYSGHAGSFQVRSGDYVLEIRSDCRWSDTVISSPSRTR
jgi:hypothetical protein